ncbi:MAG: FecR domain-containing protein [Pseudomonas sp.]
MDEAPVAPAVVERASQWLMLHWGGELDARQLADFDSWHAADPEHRRAWQRLQQLQGTLAGVPATTARRVFNDLPDRRRRDLLKLLGVLLAAGGSGLVASEVGWRETFADQRTGTGERRQLSLEDGSTLALNSGSAVDIRFNASERRICLLAGEIFCQGVEDSRPLVVETAAGDIRSDTRAGAARFAVREIDGGSRVDSYQGGLEILPRHAMRVPLKAGQRVWFDANGAGPLVVADVNANAWSEGRLVAERMPLGQFLAELGRYRPGVLRCAPDAASLQLTGVFPLADTQRILAAVERTLPVRVSYLTRYWVTVERRA